MNLIKILFTSLLFYSNYFKTAERITLHRPLTPEEIEAYNLEHPENPYNPKIIMPEGLLVKKGGKIPDEEDKKNDMRIQRLKADMQKYQQQQKEAKAAHERLTKPIHQSDPRQISLWNGVNTNNLTEVQNAIDAGADVNCIYSDGPDHTITLLHYASDPKIMELLLQNGANPNAIMTRHGVPPAFLLSSMKNPRILKLLIKYGADINATWEGYPLLALTYDYPLARNILLNAGANPNDTLYTGQTIMEYWAWATSDNENSHRYFDLIKHGAIVPDHLKNNPFIKEANRRLIPQKIAKAKKRSDIAKKFTSDLTGMIEEYL